MNKNATMLAALVSALLAGAAHAEIYICQDAAGRTLTSDRQIMECADRKVRVMGQNGLTKREISAPLTDEQKRQLQAEQEKRKAAIAVAEEQRRQDRALLARFSKESDIEVARQRALDQAKEHITREGVAIANAEQRLKEARAAASHKKGKPVPGNLQRTISESEQSIIDSRQQIRERNAEMAKINGKYDQSVKRFRELNGTATTNANPAAQ